MKTDMQRINKLLYCVKLKMGNSPSFTQSQADGLYQRKGEYSSRSEHSALNDSVSQLRSTVDQLNSTGGWLKTGFNNINRNYASLNDTIGNFRTTVAGSIGSLGMAVGSLTSSLGQFNSMLAAGHNSIGSLGMAVGSLTSSLGQFNSTLQSGNNSIGSLGMAVGSLTSSLSQVNNTLNTKTLWCATGEICELPPNKRLQIGDYTLGINKNRLCFQRGAKGNLFCFDGTIFAPAPPNVDCQVSDWSAWTVCDNNATRTRTRTVTVQQVENGSPCPNLTETLSCAVIVPLVDSVVSAFDAAERTGTGHVEILTTDTAAMRIEKVNNRLLASNGKNDLLASIGSSGLNGRGMIILQPPNTLSFFINIRFSGMYTFAFDVFGPGFSSDSFNMTLTGPGTNVTRDWNGAGGSNTNIIERVWDTRMLSPGIYKLTIRGREPTGLVNVKIRPAFSPAPSPSPSL